MFLAENANFCRVALRERRRGDTHPAAMAKSARTPFLTFAVGFDLYASHDAGCALLYDLYVPAVRWKVAKSGNCG